AGHRDTGGLDLAVRDPPRLERLDAEVAEVHAGAALGEPGHPATLGLAVTNLAGHQHRRQSSSPWNFGASWGWRVRRSLSSSSARRRSSSGSASFTSGVASSPASSPSPPSAPGAASGARRRPPPALTTRRTAPWPDVSPIAIAASLAILSSLA